MVVAYLLLWVGIQLSAPTWFIALTVCQLIVETLKWLLDIWKKFFN